MSKAPAKGKKRTKDAATKAIDAHFEETAVAPPVEGEVKRPTTIAGVTHGLVSALLEKHGHASVSKTGFEKIQDIVVTVTKGLTIRAFENAKTSNGGECPKGIHTNDGEAAALSLRCPGFTGGTFITQEE